MLRAVIALALVAVAAPNSIGEGVCGNPSCSPMQAASLTDACNTAPSAGWDANAHRVTTLAQCVALAKADGGCKMANYVSFSKNGPEGHSARADFECEWYSVCDMSKLNPNPGVAAHVAGGDASEHAHNGSEHALGATCAPRYYPYQTVDVSTWVDPPDGDSAFGWSWGWTFSVGMAVLTAAYLSAGMALNVARGGTDGGRLRVPHAEMWKELWRLTQDGAAFVRGRGGYEAVVVTHQDGHGDVDSWQKRGVDASQARSKPNTLGTWMDSGKAEETHSIAEANGSVSSSSSSTRPRAKAGAAHKKDKKHRSDKKDKKDKSADKTRVRGSRSSKTSPTAKGAPSRSRSVI